MKLCTSILVKTRYIWSITCNIKFLLSNEKNYMFHMLRERN